MMHQVESSGSRYSLSLAVYSTVCYSKTLNSMQGNQFTHPSKIRQQLWFSLALSAHPPSPWFMFRTVHVNQLLINPNGVNECQSESEWFAPTLINTTSHIHMANHWLAGGATYTQAHSTALDFDLSVEESWPPDFLPDTRTLYWVKD